MPDESIRELILRQKSRDGGAVALLAPGRDPLTYRGLIDQIDHAVSQMRAAGVTLGDRIAIILPNGPEMAVAFLATATIAACAPLNPAYRDSELDHYLQDLKPNALIVGTGMDSPGSAVARRQGIPVIELKPELDSAAGIFSLQGFQSSVPTKAGVAASSDIALLLHTSGTTSLPKMVPLTQSNLCHSARNIAASLELTPGDRCLNVMPLFHIHGLIGALLSSLSVGASVACTPGFAAHQFFPWLSEFRPTWYTAVPTMHATILARAAQTGPALSECSLRFIRSCSAALPPRIMAQLEQVFSVPVVEAYGMTEASHQITINPLPPRTRKPGSVGLSTGTDVAIMDEDGNRLGANQTGAIVIRGPSLTLGYIGVPGGGYLLEPGNDHQPDQPWFPTGDQGFVDEDGYLFINGRTKEMINRGGETISPREIEEVLLDHPSISEAVVFALPDTRLGEDIGAAVVLRDKQMVSENELRDHVGARLSYFKLPRRFVFLSAIPKGPTGKVQRIGLAEKLGITKLDSGHDVMPFAAPCNPMEELLVGMYRRALYLEDIGTETHFFDAGGDSLSALELLVNIEQATGIRLSMAALFDAPTVQKLAELIAQGGETGKSHLKLLYIQPSGSRPPFFVVHAGPLFRRLAYRLGVDQPFIGVHTYPEDLPDPVTLQDIARDHVNTILEAQPEGPYVVGGWCVGGLVAYEVAQQLRAIGKEVRLLVLFDTERPTSGSNKLAGQAVRLNEQLHAQLAILRKLEVRLIPGYVFELVQALAQKWRRRIWQLRYRSHVITGIRMKAKARDIEELVYYAAKYYTLAPYPGPVLLIRRTVRSGNLKLGNEGNWIELLDRLTIREVPGDHREMFIEPAVEVTAEILSEVFARVSERPADDKHPRIDSRFTPEAIAD